MDYGAYLMCLSVLCLLQSSAAYSAAKDVFFSELSNILSRGLRHVIAPPSATWHHRVSVLRVAPSVLN